MKTYRRFTPSLASCLAATVPLFLSLVQPAPLRAGLAGYNNADSGLSGLTHTLLSDDMANLNGWTHVDGGTPTLITSDPAVTHEPYLSLNNSLVRAELDQTLKQDFTVSIKMLHTVDNSRAQWVGLFDSAGRKGYAVLWDSTVAGGNGMLSIRKFDLPSELLVWNTASTQTLGSPVDSGKLDTTKPFGIVKLTWDNYTHTLTASMDGVQKVSVTDSSFSSFSRIYIKGNTTGLFDDVTVSTGNKLQSGTLVNDRFTGFIANTDPTAKPDQTWKVLSGGATIVDDSANPGERRLKFTGAGSRLSTPIASVLGSTTNEPLINISYDIRKSNTSGTSGAICLVNDNGDGYVFVTEMRADSFNDTLLRVYTTLDFGATWTQIGSTTFFSGVTGQGNHSVCFSWNRSSGAKFGVPVNTIVGMIDGQSPQTIATSTAYTSFTQALAFGYSANVVFMDNVLVTSVPGTAWDLAAQPNITLFDTTNDTGIQTGINNAPAGATIYARPGTYTHSGTIIVDGKKLIGAGNSTRFHATSASTSAILVRGSGAAVRRLRTTSVATTRLSSQWAASVAVDNGNDTVVTNYVITDVQAEGAAQGGIYTKFGSYGNIVNNTVMNSKADAIHNTHQTNNVQIFNNHVRNPGDDQIAVVSYAGDVFSPCTNIQVFHNVTKDQNTNGRGLTVVGGNNVTIDNNEVNNTLWAGIYIASEGSYNSFGCDNIVVRRNNVIGPRCQSHAGIYIYGRSGTSGAPLNISNATTDTLVERNTVSDSLKDGIRIGAYTSGTIVTNNLVDTPTTQGINALSAGSLTFHYNVVRNTGEGGIYIDNNCTGTHVVDFNDLIDINTSGNAVSRAIHVYSSTLDFLTITNNDYSETNSALDVEKFIRCHVPASKVNKGGTGNGSNTTTTGEQSWWDGVVVNP